MYYWGSSQVQGGEWGVSLLSKSSILILAGAYLQSHLNLMSSEHLTCA